MLAFLMSSANLLRRQSEAGGCGVLGCFFFIVMGGLILFLVLRGRRDRPERLGASKRGMGSGPIADHRFPCPYPKCPTCSASGDKMKQQWDGLRKVTWTCGYCGNIAGVQELKDEELPPSARQRLGLDPPRPGFRQGDGGFVDQGGSGMGGLLTGMMIGSMMNGGHHHRDDGWSGDSGGSDWSDTGSGSDSNSDWGDSGSSDSGGDWGDSGGGDSGGDSGGDW